MNITLAYLSFFSALTPIIVGIIKRNILTRALLLVLVISLIAFIADLVSIFPKAFLLQNYIVIHCYSIAEIYVLGLFYYRSLHLPVIRNIFIILTVLYISDVLFFSNEFNFNSGIIAIICLSFISISLFGLYKLFTKEEYLFMDQSPIFWCYIAILTYFSGSFFSWLLFDAIQINGEGSWIFHNIANILKNILFAIGLWKVRAAT